MVSGSGKSTTSGKSAEGNLHSSLHWEDPGRRDGTEDGSLMFPFSEPHEVAQPYLWKSCRVEKGACVTFLTPQEIMFWTLKTCAATCYLSFLLYLWESLCDLSSLYFFKLKKAQGEKNKKTKKQLFMCQCWWDNWKDETENHLLGDPGMSPRTKKKKVFFCDLPWIPETTVVPGIILGVKR